MTARVARSVVPKLRSTMEFAVGVATAENDQQVAADRERANVTIRVPLNTYSLSRFWFPVFPIFRHQH